LIVNHSKKSRSNERGAVLIWVSLFLLTMLGFVALGIDVAKVATGRTQLQNAADMAALAGASKINFSTGAIVQDSAVVRAQSTAFHHKAFVEGAEPIQVAAADISFPAPNQCRVIVRREAGFGGEIVMHVAQVLGITSLSMTADATAIVEPATQVNCGLAPLFMAPPPGEEFQVGCATSYTMKFGGGSGSQGNYGALQLPDCTNGACAGMPATGAATFRCLLEHGYCCPVSVGDVLYTQTGVMSGPTTTGLTQRFNSDTDRRKGICYSQYTGNGARVIYVPITSDPGAGHSTVTVLKFAAFFLKDTPTGGSNSEISGEFLYETIPGSGGGPTAGTAYAIQLIE
jgi:hypothetical protein